VGIKGEARRPDCLPQIETVGGKRIFDARGERVFLERVYDRMLRLEGHPATDGGKKEQGKLLKQEKGE